MRRLKITDLPKDVEISKDEMRRLRGGAFDGFLKIDGVRGESMDNRPVEQVTLGGTEPIIDIPH